MLSIPIIIEEYAGIDRVKESVTMGIPLPKGLLFDISGICLFDHERGYLQLQTQPLAKWPDGSVKWLLLDFQVSVRSKTLKELNLTRKQLDKKVICTNSISISEAENSFEINTGVASFFINTEVFKPFNRVIINCQDIIDESGSKLLLIDEAGKEYEPWINNIFITTEGKLRTTLKIEGKFKSSKNFSFVNFFSRLDFYANSSLVKIDFTMLNPRAAKHPGGLWDLGDPGSIDFKDFSFNVALNSNEDITTNWQTQHDDPFTAINTKKLIIYQDSSGGVNWQSSNHVNGNGDVKNSFRGFRVYADGKIVKNGLRASPVISLITKHKTISGAVQHFWQNFPKALEAQNNSLIIRLFPHQYGDVFELQGGEQKTHTIFLDFCSQVNEKTSLRWIDAPLIPRSTPEWIARSKAVPYFIPEKEDRNTQYMHLVNTAINGTDTFLDRREIVDEYGWRNFGEFYADHEAVGHDGSGPLISHYNNQYDGIYGCLVNFLRSGDFRWFVLADQLSKHVKDIDIYHTDNDRAAYNHGMFWHTNHYLDAQTCTHRCFSKKHLKHKNKAGYGGGPALSHLYSSGLLLHYYLTGCISSGEALQELVRFVENNLEIEDSLLYKSWRCLKGVKSTILNHWRTNKLVNVNKVYGLNGPGRASGNALNTLVDGYLFSGDKSVLLTAEALIRKCIHPQDNIEKRDLHDLENRWMYTIFLQSLGKYLDIKTAHEQTNSMWRYAKKSLLHYAKWLVENETLYLKKPEKLEFPNETWAAQELRKCNVLLYAAKYSEPELSEMFLNKASYFYEGGLSELLKFDTKMLTRPLSLVMLNGMMYSYFCRQAAKVEKSKKFAPQNVM